MRGWTALLAVAALWFGLGPGGPPAAWGGAFRVVPTRLNVDQRTGTTIFRLQNSGDSKVTVQFYAVRWNQDDTGRDKLERTREILIFPQQVTLESGKERVVRIGYRGRRGGPEERTYRLIAEELPSNAPGEQTMLRLLLRFSVPIFVPAGEDHVAWRLGDTRVAGGNAQVLVTNEGNRHVVVQEVRVRGFDAAGGEVFDGKGRGWYVLAGVSKPFGVKLPGEVCPKVRSLAITVVVGDKPKEARASLEPGAAGCNTAG